MKKQPTTNFPSVIKTILMLFAVLAINAGAVFSQSNTSCNAQFTYANSFFNAGEVEFFTSHNPPHATYSWDFGDTTTSNHRNPTHTYAQSGTYYVCLTITVTGNNACTDTWCDSVVVATPTISCNAHFTSVNGLNPNEVHFASGLNPPGSVYTWDFGDTTTSSQAFPVHTYSQGGTYYVCLTVTDSAGGVLLCTDTWCDSVHVGGPMPCDAHFASFSGINAGTVYFTGAPNPPGTMYSWDFGDTTTATGNAVSHTYLNSGTYNVCLTVTDTANNCTATWCDSIQVTIPAPVCNAHFSFHNSLTTLGNVSFAGSLNPPGSTFYWNYGDGTLDTGMFVSHTYAALGTYYVCLTVTDTAGGIVLCTDTWCDSVHVTSPGCNAHFNHSCGHQGMTIRFNPSSLVSSTYSWDFGDGSPFATIMNPVHNYAQPGVYYVCLTVTDTMGGVQICTDTWCDTLFAGRQHGGCHSHHHRLANPNTDEGNSIDEVIATIYPNPVTEKSIIHLESTGGDVTFSIFESTGSLVMTKEHLADGDIEINKNDLSEGIYFFRINDSNGILQTGKFIVQ